MKNVLVYDVYAMKTTAKEARRLLNNLRHEISLAQKDEPQGKEADRQTVKTADELNRLLKVCNGYEAVLRNLETAANLYGTAEAAASELITF